MTREARAHVISWLAVLLVLGACIYVIMNVVEKHQEENQQKMSETVGDLGTINVSIQGNTYEAKIESNNTAKDFLKLLPMTLNMTDQNGNEKYSYVYSGLSTNVTKTKNILAGDIVLSGSSTIKIFYKSTKSSGKVIKIGHIDNLPDLGSDNISVSFNK